MNIETISCIYKYEVLIRYKNLFSFLYIKFYKTTAAYNYPLIYNMLTEILQSPLLFPLIFIMKFILFIAFPMGTLAKEIRGIYAYITLSF